MTTRIKAYTARQLGIKMGLDHKEVIRRIRKRDIEASKLGWFWVIDEDAAERAMNSEWYQRYKK
jgi:hypothetical protein